MTARPIVYKTAYKEIVFKTTSEEIITYNAADSLSFIGSSDFIVLPFPYFGYKTIIRSGLHYSNVNGGYKIGDDGSEYDSRICEIPTWLMPQASQTLISNFLDNISGGGRGNNFTLHLPVGSGFFPFGADLGDEGDFVVSVIDYQKGGALEGPYLRHTNSLTLALVTAPSYTPPAAEGDGTFSIEGTLYRPPQVFPLPDEFVDISRASSRDGTIYSTDAGTTKNYYETDVSLQMREGNCATFIADMLSTRGGDITIISGANTWLFGIDNGDYGTYYCRRLNKDIEIVHENYDLWTTNLRLWMRA